MEIKDVDVNSIMWNTYGYGPYADICEKIKKADLNSAFTIILDKPTPGLMSAMSGRIKRMDPDFKVTIKMLDRKEGKGKMGKRWAIGKFELKEGKRRK